MSQVQPYVYDLIPDYQSTNSIRLLTLLPGEFGTPIQGFLTLAPGIFSPPDLAQDDEDPLSKSDTKRPDFEAVSYVWGDPSVRTSILINGYELMVTVNLELFLQRLRKVDNERVVWADAICIDQTNVDERNSQVMMMAQIYESATHVPIWLGKEDEDTKMAFDAVSKLFHGGRLRAERLRAGNAGNAARLREPELNETNHPSITWAELSLSQVVAMENTFVGKTWWERIWVLQECVLAKEATIMCGEYSLPWKSIELVMYPGELGKHVPPIEDSTIFRAFSSLLGWCSLQLVKLNGAGLDGLFKRQQLHDVMNWGYADGPNRRCTDPRDIVYGILSLVPFEPNSIIPDYRKSVSAVYTEVTRALIRQQQSLITICVPTMQRPTLVTSFEWVTLGEKVPSWVPDYYGLRKSPIVNNATSWLYRNEPFNCSIKLPFDSHLTLSETDDILRIQCIKWDKISHVYQIHLDFRLPSDEHLLRVYIHSQNIKQLCSRLEVVSAFSYPTGEDIAGVVYRTLRRDVVLPNSAFQRQDHASVQQYKVGFHDWYNEDHGEWDVDALTEDELIEKGRALFEREEVGADLEFVDSLTTFIISTDQTFFITEKGYMGVIKTFAEIGDEICVANGACVPLVVRSAGKNFRGKIVSIPEAGFYTLVGEAYVHGIMDGEAVDLVGGVAQDTVFLV